MQTITQTQIELYKEYLICEEKSEVAVKKYIRERMLTSGSVFVTRKGKPLDRFFIWKAMI